MSFIIILWVYVYIYSSDLTPPGGQDCVCALAVSSPSHSGKKLVNKKVQVMLRSKGGRCHGFSLHFLPS